MRRSITANRKVRALAILSWLAIWEIGYLLVGKEVLIPSPFHTLQTLLGMMKEESFYLHILATFKRVLMGVGLSLALGILTAVLGFYNELIQAFIRPAIHFMKSTPVMAVIILALLWFKSDEVPVFVCFLMCYPIIYTNISEGLIHLDQELIEMSKLYHVHFMTRFISCDLPQLAAYLKAALDLGLGMAFKVVIAAEVLAIPKYAIGYQLLDAKIYLETEEVFAWVIVIALVSHLCSKGIELIFKKREIR